MGNGEPLVPVLVLPFTLFFNCAVGVYVTLAVN